LSPFSKGRIGTPLCHGHAHAVLMQPATRGLNLVTRVCPWRI
jgi:hypothetical protein